MYDAIVIGTGFGGAVTAARLVEAGLDVCVLERGRRFLPGDFPELPSESQGFPDTRRWRWSPSQGAHGLWETRDLRGLVTVHAAGYGGGSLIYANVHLRAPSETFAHGWPEGWSREALDPYYDVVARRIGLELAPERIADGSGRPQTITKRDQLVQAFDQLGRGSDWVKAPLAVRFGEAAGEGRGSCTACGACDTGCNEGAKKTLDQNYLAAVDEAAERSAVGGAPRVDVHTLAEAQWIEELEADGAAPRFAVHYIDHLEGERDAWEPLRRRVTARSVFLCAGAVGSTELLLRSRERGGLSRLSGALGRGFSPNADSLGMVFDTEHAQKPDVGPTITSILSYRGPAAGRDDEGDDVSVLLQDGGYALPIAGSFRAVFRSPLWGGRNRYRESALPGVGRVGPSPCDGEREMPVPVGRRADASFPVALYRTLGSGGLPPALAKLASETWSEAGRRLNAIRAREEKHLVRTVVDRMRDRVWELLLRRHAPLRAIVATSPRVHAWARRQLDELMSEVSVEAERAARSVIDERLSLEEPDRWIALLIRRLAGERSATLEGTDPERARLERDHVAMLLAMGRDRRYGELTLDARGELDAHLGGEPGEPVYSTQEALMRDVARTLGGELRTYPDWAWNGRPVTVHPQGGCAMADDPDLGVTDGEGRVHGHGGLFVFDAGAFPTSIGVNPSHTIAAMAERNVERFLERQAKDEGWLSRRADEKRVAATWVNDFRDPESGERGRGLLDPLRARRAKRSEPPRSKPVGITFGERMVGFVSSVACGPQDLEGVEVDPERAREGERRGRAHQQLLDVAIRVSTDNLQRFLESERHVLAVEGRATLQGSGPPRIHPVTGELALMIVDGDGNRRMRYELRDEEGTLFLVGEKRVGRRHRLDPYGDTMALHVTMVAPGEEQRLDGVLRVPLQDFLEVQLPSLRATGTDDPLAATWALVDFAAFFFGHLGEVYADAFHRALGGVGARQLTRARERGLARRAGRPPMGEADTRRAAE